MPLDRQAQRLLRQGQIEEALAVAEEAASCAPGGEFSQARGNDETGGEAPRLSSLCSLPPLCPVHLSAAGRRSHEEPRQSRVSSFSDVSPSAIRPQVPWADTLLAEAGFVSMAELEFDRAVARPTSLTPLRCSFSLSSLANFFFTVSKRVGSRFVLSSLLDTLATAPRPEQCHHAPTSPRLHTAPQGYWRRCRGLEPAEVFPYVPSAAGPFLSLVPRKPYWDAHPPVRDLAALVRDVLLARWVASGGSPQALQGAQQRLGKLFASLCLGFCAHAS